MITPEERLSVIAQAAQRLQESAAVRLIGRREAFHFAEAIGLVANASGHHLEANRAQIEETLGVKLPESPQADLTNG